MAIQIGVKLVARERLQQLLESFQEAGNRGVPECRQQHPPPSLVETVAQQGTHLLVGWRGSSRVGRFVMGSVSEDVLHHMPFSGLIIPGPRNAA
jgi:nucleotide-binding universal stress UspA family protein